MGGACPILGRSRRNATRLIICSSLLVFLRLSLRGEELFSKYRLHKWTESNKPLVIMALDGCGLACKYILFIFNLIFAVLGFVFLGLGVWLRFSAGTRGIFEVEALNSSTFVAAVTVLIVLGVVFLIMVSFGDYGACSEKKCALQVFSVIVSIMAGAEIAVGVLAYTNRAWVGRELVEFYSSMYALYVANGDPIIGITLTFIHKTLHCCGMTGISLIELVQQTCPEPDGFLQRFAMPNCPGIIVDVFDRKAELVMGIFIGIGALLIIALICSTTLSKKMHQSASSPQYLILTQPQTSQFVSTSYPNPDNDPVVFTPLTMANIPIA
ncbi:CD9 antigen [Morone saxatilis]|uniref:CD9 antigen n=1 Tax=Morone saxatilis TaxID=34816 RepID=UPI0015E20385|nr:CD9 antigen [Morone saxatilis]